MKKLLHAGAAGALTAGLVLVGSGSASAHVTVVPDTTTAGAYALLTFGVPHGCGESATTEVSLQIPEQIITVTPTVNPGWEIEKVMATLDEPVDDGHGGQYTERVAEVVYTTDTPLPNGYRDAFVLSVKLPDSAGDTLVFPAVQTCEEGESAWVQLPAEGQDLGDLEMPAPMFELTAAPADEEGEAQADAAVDGSTSAVSWVALALGGAGLLLGGAAFLRSRRATS
ncbi:YcnI family protein [Oerskovia flava]|uniref:YcnI family copper-binding membrane protein n=1 Tax=Oerskovia flava TaxID=2986422 RepID=UPI00223EA942|nr:YcnI family protein [Oerskovia sp. JB1-3-2]